MNKTLLTLIVGIGIGLLLAPSKGSETWKRLKEGFNDFKEDGEDEADQLVNAGKKALKNGKRKVEEAIH
jgi:gas vesicle protein